MDTNIKQSSTAHHLAVVLGIAFSVSVSGSDLIFHAIKSGLSFVVVALPPSLVIWYYRKRYF